VRLALAHQTTDRIPIAMVCSGINSPVDAQLDRLLRQERGIDLKSYLAALIDIRAVQPIYAGPRLATGEDIWGVRRTAQSFGAGAYDEIVGYPLASAVTPLDLDSHRWPNPDWFDYNALKAGIDNAQSDGEYCLMIHNGNIFETSWYMRGFEQIFMDIALNPELVYAIFERVCDFYCAYFRRILEVAAGRVDLAFTADDIAGQNGLLVSLKTWEALIKPFHARLNKVIHEFGVKVIYHSDGAVTKAVPGLIDMGIDVLQA
jgi:uroporphyrinogen decarboxylase